ncbi:LBF_2017 N-terminal domain-containing protein [Leptospira bouyouniensis]|uniref:Uncharacterized protein n=1 Tax=Leptospira bouyouniensis TaxID=2484911 RepID=A0ABY2L7S4_9LEPT|nr:hypothetical protein [Leptospira bouyouniensis]TGK48644.1 hypothetical protein EHQ10_13145 [Leptospira bouyouniensis]TGM81015.1 hypothetical protein EHQ99_15410 [Leptospira bouyouniensis]
MKQTLTLILTVLFLILGSLESKPKRELRILIDADAEAKFELELWQDKPNETEASIAPKPPEVIQFKGNRITVTPKDDFEYFRVRRLGDYGAKGFWTQVYSTNVDPSSPLSVPKEFVSKKTFEPKPIPKKIVSVVSNESFVIVKEKEETRFLTKDFITVAPVDDASGVAEVRYRINDGQWNSAKSLASIPFSEEGEYKLLYFSIDMAGNKEPIQIIDFVRDTKPPETSVEWIGSQTKGKGNMNFLSPDSKIRFVAKDNRSGLKDILYSTTCQSGTQTEFKSFTSDLSVVNLKTECKGSFQIFYYAIDQVGNEEAVKTLNFQLGSESN